MKSILRTLVILFSVCLVCTAQGKKEFEVASIRPVSERQSDQVVVGVRIDGSQVRISYLSLKDYIAIAFRVRMNQIEGPDWLGSQRFDIAGKIPDGAPQSDVPEMLQSLLAERFQMKMHREMREFPVYALRVAETGLKLVETGPGDTNGAINIAAGGSPNGVGINFGDGSSFSMGSNTIEIKKLTMRTIADSLTRFLDRPVIDMTNLKAAYDASLPITPEDRLSMMVRAAVAAGMVLPPRALAMLDNGSSASVVDSLKKAGLTLSSQREPLEVLIIDQIEKTPTEN